MQVGKSFTFVFEDNKWLGKILLGALLSIIPILNLVTVGYMVRVIRNVAAGTEHPLPDWDDLGQFFVDGLLVTIAGLIYALPLVIIGIAYLVLMIAGAMAGGDAVALPLVVGWYGVLLCIFAPYCLLLGAWTPAMTVNYAARPSFGALFHLGEIWGLIRRNLGNYVIAIALYLVMSQVASWVGTLVCLIGVFVTSFWLVAFNGHLLGQVLKNDKPSTPAAPVLPGTPAASL
jgi:hypothetical protein